MSTKDEFLLLKDKHKSFNYCHTETGAQYSDLNLNQNLKESNIFPIQSISKLYNDKKIDSTLSESYEEKEKLQIWKKSSQVDLCSNGLFLNDENKKCWKKNDFLNVTNNSTLSFHISAYEKSKDASYDSFNKSSQKSWLIQKQKQINNASILVSQNPFEFQRQQNDKIPEPEVSQYKASKRLFNTASTQQQPGTSSAISQINQLRPIPGIDDVTDKTQRTHGPESTRKPVSVMKEIDPESTRQNPLSPASTGSPASVVKDINRSQMGTVMGNTSVMGNASAMGSVIRPLEKSQNHKPHEELSDSVTKSLFGNNLFSDAPSPQQAVTQVKERGVGDIKILYKGHVPPSPPETPAPAPQPPFVAAASPKNNNNNNRRGDGNDNNREKGGENQQQQQRNVKPQKQPSHHTQPVQKDAPILPPANITAVEPPPPQHAPTNRQPQQPGGNGKVENEMECGQESLASSDSDDSIASYTISKSLEDILDALTPSPGFEKFYFRPRNLHLHDPRYTYVSSEEEFSDGPFESAVDVGESSEFSINAGNSWEGHDDLLLNEDYSNGVDNLTINDDHLMRSEDSNVDVYDDVFAGETGIDIVESLELSINALTVDEGPSSMNRRGGCGGGEGPLSMNGRGGGRGGGGGGGGEGPSSMNGRGGGCGGGGEGPSSMNGRGGGGGVEAQPGARKIRANRSQFWDFVYESEEGWKCVYCHKVIEVGKSRTDHISSHLQKVHNWPKEKIRELKKRKNDERSISTAPPIKKQKKQVVQSLPTKTGAVDVTDDEVLAGGEEEEGEGGWDVHDDVELPAYIDPAISIQLDELNQSLQACYRLTTEGKFSDAIKELRQILLEVLRVASWQKIAQARQLVEICRKYLVGLLMEVKRQALNANSEAEKIRSLELAAYFTHCDLQPPHKILTLRTAVKLSHGLQQLKLCASFAQRCIELGPEPDVAQTMRKYLAACDKNLNDKHEINYDEHDPFVVCSKTFMPLYQGNPQSKCSFCGASFDPKFIGEVCDVCQIFEIGGDVIGLEISTAESGR